jgi:hypothetical protein
MRHMFTNSTHTSLDSKAILLIMLSMIEITWKEILVRASGRNHIIYENEKSNNNLNKIMSHSNYKLALHIKE